MLALDLAALETILLVPFRFDSNNKEALQATSWMPSMLN
jgi:hypothetical protein